MCLCVAYLAIFDSGSVGIVSGCVRVHPAVGGFVVCLANGVCVWGDEVFSPCLDFL